MLDKYVSDLCDKYAHYGEFLCQEFVDLGKSKRGLDLCGISMAMRQKVLKGAGVGAATSAALGKYLGAPPEHYERLYRLFSAEKKRRAAL